MKTLKLTIILVLSLLFAQNQTFAQIVQLKKMQPKKVKGKSWDTSHNVKYLIDGSAEVGNSRWNDHFWAAGAKNKEARDPQKGIGATVRFNFKSPVNFKQIRIVPGLGNDKKLYLLNNRPTKIKVESSAGESIILDLKDQHGWQEFSLDLWGESLTFTILEKKLGTWERAMYETFSIAEVEFYAEDPILKQLLSAVKEDDAMETNKSIRRYFKEIAKDTPEYRSLIPLGKAIFLIQVANKKGFPLSRINEKLDRPLIEYALKQGKPNVVAILLEEFTVDLSKIQIEGISPTSTNEEIIEYARNQRLKNE